MSTQHRRPMLAFLTVAVLCIVLLGHAVRSDAFGPVNADDRASLGYERVWLAAVVRDRVVVDAERVRSPRAPAYASATRWRPRVALDDGRGPESTP